MNQINTRWLQDAIDMKGIRLTVDAINDMIKGSYTEGEIHTMERIAKSVDELYPSEQHEKRGGKWYRRLLISITGY